MIVHYSFKKLGRSVSIPAIPGFPTTTMAAAAALEFITMAAVRQHTATVIFLHVGTTRPGSHDVATFQLICIIKPGLR